ncbi:MAG TPA: YfbU family protein [Pseudonocardiaceae bacterium]|nr:YfbU family protein [Pseudonocardiaceae bacterium]
MAVLNIRVDDRVRDRLKEMADGEGVSLSEFVRDLIMETVVPVYPREAEHGDESAQESMRIVDRQVLSLLHRILARVLPKDANDVDGDLEYQLMRASILEAGYTGEYWYETAGFRTELSKRDCMRVSDILEMFRIITYSIDHLANVGTPVDEKLAFQLEFRGFDHNDALEGHMASYVDFLMRDNRWTELKPQLVRNDNGNSHSRVLDTYQRMLAEYRRIVDDRERGYSQPDYYLLSPSELEQICGAQVHPSHRHSARE